MALFTACAGTTDVPSSPPAPPTQEQTSPPSPAETPEAPSSTPSPDRSETPPAPPSPVQSAEETHTPVSAPESPSPAASRQPDGLKPSSAPKPSPTPPAVATPDTAPSPTVAPSPSPASIPAAEGITISITGSDGALVRETVLSAEGIETAADALKAACKLSDLSLKIRGSGATAYVEAIGNYKEFGDGPLSGWIYKVNGTQVSYGVGGQSVSPGDRVSFYFSKDMGQDVKDKP